VILFPASKFQTVMIFSNKEAVWDILILNLKRLNQVCYLEYKRLNQVCSIESEKAKSGMLYRIEKG
jgi:hypothetical protein